MSEQKWTKGRWYPFKAAGWCVGSEGGKGAIIVGGLTENFLSDEYEEECKANANLIAASPDLYNALIEARKSVVYELEFLDVDNLTTQAKERELKQRLLVIDTALAKARGES
jgi:hypothetical protein